MDQAAAALDREGLFLGRKRQPRVECSGTPLSLAQHNTIVEQKKEKKKDGKTRQEEMILAQHVMGILNN